MTTGNTRISPLPSGSTTGYTPGGADTPDIVAANLDQTSSNSSPGSPYVAQPTDTGATQPTAGTPTDTSAGPAAGQPVAAPQAMPEPTTFSSDERQAFKNLGLSDGQIDVLGILGPKGKEINALYEKIKADPSVIAKLPDSPEEFKKQLAEMQAQQAPAGVGQAAQGGLGIQGKPGWSNEWHDKFYKLGVPDQIIQQFDLTGGMGLDDAAIQQQYDGYKTQINEILNPFKKEFGESYEKLLGFVKEGTIPPSYVVAVAGTAAQKFADDKIEDKKERKDFVKTQLVDTIPMQLKMAAKGVPTGPLAIPTQIFSMFRMMPPMLIKQIFTAEGAKMMLPWTVVPGWGALRYVGALGNLALGNGFTEPITGTKLHLNPLEGGAMGLMDIAMAAGGAWSLYSSYRGLSQIHNGLKLIENPNAAKDVVEWATRHELNDLHGFKRFMAYMPRTQNSGLLSAAGRFDSKFDTAVQQLSKGDDLAKALGVFEKPGQYLGPQELALKARGDFFADNLNLWGKTGFGNNIPMLGNGARNSMPPILMGNRKAPMYEIKMMKDGTQRFTLNVRNEGESFAAFAAQMGAETTPAQQLLASPYETLGLAAKDLGLPAKQGPVQKVWSFLRPGPTTDAVAAASLLDPAHKVYPRSGGLKSWGVGLGVGLGTYMLFGKDLGMQGMLGSAGVGIGAKMLMNPDPKKKILGGVVAALGGVGLFLGAKSKSAGEKQAREAAAAAAAEATKQQQPAEGEQAPQSEQPSGEANGGPSIAERLRNSGAQDGASQSQPQTQNQTQYQPQSQQSDVPDVVSNQLGGPTGADQATTGAQMTGSDPNASFDPNAQQQSGVQPRDLDGDPNTISQQEEQAYLMEQQQQMAASIGNLG